ncbi:MAG: hypothetical protein IMX02_01090 [Limnochordaceae bacterium]|nr:hypothetical protein [Limnochordaceae bacterium]
MTKTERVRHALAGEAVDRPPFSIWFHFGTQHLPPSKTAAIHLDFFRAYDLDWLKVMSDYRYPMPEGIEEVASLADLRRFRRFEMDSEPFSLQLQVLREIGAALGDEAPFVETVFSPFGVARRTLRSHMDHLRREDPDAFKTFLESVTETLRRYVRAVAQTGAAGVFFSVNGAGQGEMKERDFEEWVLPYDLAVLATVNELAREGRFYFNVIHIHGERLRWRPIMDQYPGQVFNWSVHHSPPSFAQARLFTPRPLMGGIDEVGLSSKTPSEVRQQVRTAIEQAGAAGLFIAPGCAVPTDVPPDLIRAAAQACRA